MSDFLVSALSAFVIAFIAAPTFFGILRLIGLYTIVEEGTCAVYQCFGRVVGEIREPGFHFLPFRIWWYAPLITWFGRRYTVDMRLDQVYLRSQPVNSEEGAPMGIGIWYEMYIGDPTAFLFKNADPRGSLRANVSNAVVRCLSNMKLAAMLENRHDMSAVVREEVSPKSREWGYKLGSIYIRKVHFRDLNMIRQIEEKVVNRLRQVTSAIKQDGTNQVNIIASTAEKKAAVEFAKAAAVRPQIVGDALTKISKDPEVAATMFEILETQRIIENKAELTLVPKGGALLQDLLAARGEGRAKDAESYLSHGTSRSSH